jgi:alpha-1,3-rhamnosyl/mannosyltransferase
METLSREFARGAERPVQALLDARTGRKPTGIGMYVMHITREFARLGANVQPIAARHQHRRWRSLGLRPVTAPWRGEMDVTSLPSADVIHGPNFHALPHPKAAQVATIHDLGYVRLPECHPPGMAERLDNIVRASLERTRLFICDSACTRDDFVDRYGVPMEQCRVVHLGVDERFSPHRAPADARILRRHSLRKPYILHVGAMVPRKDLPTLVRAFEGIVSTVDVDLVLAGNKTRRWATDWPKVKELLNANADLRRRVKVLNYVRSSELPALYRNATAVGLASRWEGFGLTVLEGLASGVPVVASRVSSIPEIAGETVIYGQPGDADSFAEGLMTAIHENGSARARRDEGLRIAGRLTWRATAEATLSAYTDARDLHFTDAGRGRWP